MKADFSQPQRQSIVGVFVMFFYTLQQYARALWPILLVWVFKFDKVNKIFLVLGLLFFIVVVGTISYLKYLNFTFFLDDKNGEFIVNEGVFNKTKTTIQLNKIQQVNINQSFIQKIIGVYELAVDTAGSQKKEGAIQAISHELALELKARLMDNEKKFNVDQQDNIIPTIENSILKENPFIKISFLSLIKVGITSNYGRSIALLLLFFSTMYENFIRLGNENIIDDEKLGNYVDQNLVLNSVLIFIIFLFLIVLIVNLVRIIFKYFDYKIVRQKGSLLLSYGLLNTKNTIVKPEKVQITFVTRNYFQKKLGILELKIKQATSGEKEERKSAIEIPGCSEKERDEVLKLLFGKIPEKGAVLKPNFRKLGFGLMLSIVVPLALFLYLGKYVFPQILEYSYFVVIYIIIMGLVQFFKFKNNKFFINENFIIKQGGAWDITNEIIEPSKIQAISTSQLFWHKSLDIGNITLHTAGGNIDFQLGNYTKIKNYINLWLYEIETSNTNWM